LIIGLALAASAGLNYLERQYKAHKTHTPKILVVWGQGTGEQEQTHRFKIAAQHIGVDLEVVSDTDGGKTAARAAKRVKPDLVLTIERDIPPVSGVPNYLVLDQSKLNYIVTDAEGYPTLVNPDHYLFTGLLPTFPEIDILKQAYERPPKAFYGFKWYPNKFAPKYKMYSEATNITVASDKFYGFNWYPTLYVTEYKAQVPTRLFYPGGVLTDNTRSAAKYKRFFAMLDKQGYLEVFGHEDRWQHTPNSLRGILPFNGISLIKVNNKFGATLILHARDHLYGDVPTGRIFEAAAANTVIISDRNKGIEQNFGDDILYIDIHESAEEVFRQIDGHMQWILAHPQQAMQMAQRCHDIFRQKFTLEAQLLNLIELNESRKQS